MAVISFFSDFLENIRVTVCDEYFVHGNFEFLEKNLKVKNFDFNDSKCLISTEGSPKHQQLLIRSKKQKKKKRFYLYLVHF